MSSPVNPAILIAETDQAVCKLQRYFLEAAGFAVEFVQDGDAAFNIAKRHHPSIIVAEILLPKLDGLALCRRVRGDPEIATIPVLIFSILNAATRAQEAGARAFLKKPLVESTFLSTIKTLVGPPTLMKENTLWASQ